MTAYRYNTRDQLVLEWIDANDNGLPDEATITSYAYDTNGNTTAKGFSTYTWDLRGRMSSASVDGTTTTYAYDHEGVRVGQATGTESRSFLYDKQNPTGYAKAVAEYVNGSLECSYILGLRMEGQGDGDGPAWFIRDGHGSNRLLTDEQGRPVELYDYAAYGEPAWGPL